MYKPLIGITAYGRTIGKENRRYHVSYIRNAAAVELAGGLPVLIPFDLREENLRAIYERMDGILLPGGEDVNPKRYQAEPHPALEKVSDERDEAEILMARWSVAEDRPLFGICRGNQVLNVALGGTLIQDIPSLIETELEHSLSPKEDRSTLKHDITVESGSRLARILGDERVPVNSIHHQSVQQAAPGLKISAYAPDGIIEALEAPDKHFVMSVQWHPEDLAAQDKRMHALFEAFIAAARERKKG